MQRVATAAAVSAMPAVQPPGTPGYFTQGNPSAGQQATVPGPDWFNAIQEEIIAVIVAAGQTPTGADLSQLLSAIKTIAAPAGKISLWPGNTAPAGYLKCNGATLNRASYADLWAAAIASGNITDEATWAFAQWGSFSSGDLVNTFRLPDFRGEFLRGWDDGRGIDLARVLGAAQAQTFISDRAHSWNVLGNETDIGIFGKNAEGTTAIVPAANGNEAYFMNSATVGGNNNTYATGFGVRPRNVPIQFVIKY